MGIGSGIGTTGYVAWFYAIIYNRIRKSCENIVVKVFVHSIGVLLIVVGLYFLITTIPSFISIGGMFLSFVGLVVFVTPLGIE